jgi:hypothetical protein
MRLPGSERHVTRPFAVGNFVFVVSTSTPADLELVESLFHDVPAPNPLQAEPAVFSLTRQGADWQFNSPRLQGQQTTTIDGALTLLVADVNIGALDAEPECLHLHAAAAIKDGRAVVIAAERGTGKTTTVAHLVSRGWGFVTDETVRLAAEGDEVTGFPKPLSIKPGGPALVDHLRPWMIPGDDAADGTFRFLPIGISGAKVVEGGTSHVVVLLRRNVGQGGTPTVPAARPLHPADAAVALMQQTLDAERFGHAAFRLATLAAHSHCYELILGTPEASVDEIEALFRLGPPEPTEVRALPNSDAFSAGVVSIAVGDRIVVHDSVSGRIFAIDAGGARVWRQLGGWADDDLDVHGPVLGSFVAQLRALGVLAGAS